MAPLQPAEKLRRSSSGSPSSQMEFDGTEQGHTNGDVQLPPGKDFVIVQEKASKGFACAARLTGRVPCSAKDMYQALCNKDRPVPFRTVKACTNVQLLEDDGAGRRRYRVEFISKWKFLRWGGEFPTAFDRHEDDQQLRVQMRLAQPCFIKALESNVQILACSTNPSECWIHVHQQLAPNFPAPDPMSRRIIKGTNVRQLSEMLEDIQAHINKGDKH